MFDLRKLPPYYIEKYGAERVAEIVEQKPQMIAMWQKTGKFPLDAVQRLLEHDPEPLSEVKPLYENPPSGTKLCVLMPLMGPPEPKTMDCLLRLFDRREMAFKRASFNNLSVARNTLAAWGLDNGFDEFAWLDGDTVVPCGDAGLFKAHAELPNYPDVFAGLHAFFRMMSHRKKAGRADATIVAAPYVSRSSAAIPQYGGGDTAAGRMDLRRGPRDELKQASWCGFGCVWHTRSVLEDIIKTQGNEIKMNPNGIGRRFSYAYGFFNPIDGETPADDIPFSIRAQRAGHKIHMDMAVQAAHIGDRAYTYADIK